MPAEQTTQGLTPIFQVPRRIARVNLNNPLQRSPRTTVMNHASKSSLLRKAISTTFFAATILLAVLAIRSYWWRDSFVSGLPNEGSVAIQSSAGKVLVGVFPQTYVSRIESRRLTMQREAIANATSEQESSRIESTSFRLGTIVVLPHWYLALVFGTCAALPWIRWQFGLRTFAGGVAVAAATLASALS